MNFLQLNSKRLALGTVQFGLNYGVVNKSGKVSRNDVRSMIQLASDSGIVTIDTAIAYGDSELCLGEIGLKGFNVVTKLPLYQDNYPSIEEWLQKEFSGSLGRLGVTSIYGLLLHYPKQLLGCYGGALYKALQGLRDRGLVEKIGISIYSPDELTSLMALYKFDLVQAPFNLIDRRLFASGWLYRLKDGGVEVHTRSTFLQGLLLIPESDMPSKFSKWGHLWVEWHRWLLEHNMSALQAALAYPLGFSEVDRIVVGADSVGQLAKILTAVDGGHIKSLPNISTEDEALINPARWAEL